MKTAGYLIDPDTTKVIRKYRLRMEPVDAWFWRRWRWLDWYALALTVFALAVVGARTHRPDTRNRP